jgi:hypothetical protein
MLMHDLVKARQEDLLREANKEQRVAALSPQPSRLTLLARRALARWRAAVANLRETRPLRRRASAWLNQR